MTLTSFGSDNHSGVHPLLFAEMQKVNQGYAPSYEQDSWSQELKKVIRKEFDAVESALVFNGTAANVISLQAALKSYEAVLCADQSHLVLDECGAPEKIAGVKLIPLPTQDGKILIDQIERFIVRKGDQHHSQIKMISITQPTEYGTLYSLAEIQKIRGICDQHNLYLHMDGARLANAAVALRTDFKTLVADVDVVSFGGAKNGLMLGEFVIVRNPALKEGLRFYRKQSLQLPAKTRFLTAPFLKYLASGLWKEIAEHENTMAQHLYQSVKDIEGIEVTRPVQANAVFCKIPQAFIKPLRKKFFFYVWDENSFEIRLMTSFASSKQDINSFSEEIKMLTTSKDYL